MEPITVREAVIGDVGGIRKLQKKVDGDTALSRADLAAFLNDRNCGGLVAEQAGGLVGCLLYRVAWADNQVTVCRLTQKPVERQLAVCDRLLRRLLVIAQNFEGVSVQVSARQGDAEMVQTLQGLGFYAADRREGLLWFSRQTRGAPPEETPDWEGRTSFDAG